MKKNKGITLIALIITIIILIILTAVTINNVIGTDLIGFATKAVENYTDVAKDEADKVDKLAGTLNNQGVGKDSKVRAGEIVEKTEKDNYTDADGRKATIPAGFKVSTKASEQCIKDGLVIQDNEGNEFVWVPCYYGETKPEGTAEDVQQYKKHEYVGTNDNLGSTVDTGNDNWMTGYYTFYSNSWFDEATQKIDIDNGKIVEDENAYGNKSVAAYGGFYIGRYEAGFPDYDTSEFKSSTVQYMTSREEETKKKNETAVTEDKKPVSKPNIFAWNLISQQNAKKVSEKMYERSETKGYANSYLVDGTAWDTLTNWIGTDIENVNDTVNYGNYNDNGSKYTGWYAEHIYASQITGKNTGGTLGLLCAHIFKNELIDLKTKRLNEDEWGKRMYDVVPKNEKNNATDNYLDTKIEIPTGSYKNFKLKNIYDLAGNMWEMTTEVGNHDTNGKFATGGVLFSVNRGGSFWDTGELVPLTYRTCECNASTTCAVHISFRVVLYIQ